MNNPRGNGVKLPFHMEGAIYYCRLPLGPTTNKMYMPVATRGRSRFVRTKEYKAWKTMVDMIDTIEGNRRPAGSPIGSRDFPVGVVIIIHGTEVDTDNCAKAHVDYLVRNGILEDDDIAIVKGVLLVAGKPLNKGQYAEIIVLPASQFGFAEPNQKTIDFRGGNDGHGRDTIGT